MTPKDRILVALDYDNADDALALARTLGDSVGGYKVGLELVNAAGFDIFDRLNDAGASRIFYDAKFHDIPNTVAGAVRSAAKRGVWMINVHASGGSAMLKAARDAADSAEKPPLLIGVTVLTSIDQLTLSVEMRVTQSLPKQVVHLAGICEMAGLDGVVASARELPNIRNAFGPDFITVIPGIRPAGMAAQDQKRVATPASAIKDGAHYLVVGRAITAADDPIAAAVAITAEIEGVV